MTTPRLSRRTALKAGTGAAALGILSRNGTNAAPSTRGGYRLAPAQTLSGRVVIATNNNPTEEVKAALTQAYQERQPNVEIAWDMADRGGEYANWLGTQLAADDIALDIPSPARNRIRATVVAPVVTVDARSERGTAIARIATESRAANARSRSVNSAPSRKASTSGAMASVVPLLESMAGRYSAAPSI